jgi:lipopolysaccharide transport system ATP-binding protein
MMVRLGFAVAAHLDPEILVVDEVLAVGDAEFQKKAIGKMQDVSKGEGRTVLFVSHNMASVKSLCKSGLLLENGMVKYRGSIQDTIDMYIGEGGSSENQYFEDLATAPGNDIVRIKSFEILPLDGSSQISIETGVLFRLKFMCYKENAMLDANLLVTTLDDTIVFQVGQAIGDVGEKDSQKGFYTVDFKIDPYTINTGRYKAEIFFGENQKYVVFSDFYQDFEVANSIVGQGYNMSTIPGFLRPRKQHTVTFEG